MQCLFSFKNEKKKHQAHSPRCNTKFPWFLWENLSDLSCSDSRFLFQALTYRSLAGSQISKVEA